MHGGGAVLMVDGNGEHGGSDGSSMGRALLETREPTCTSTGAMVEGRCWVMLRVMKEGAGLTIVISS